MVINPRVGVYISIVIKDSYFSGGMTIPQKTRLFTMAQLNCFKIHIQMLSIVHAGTQDVTIVEAPSFRMKDTWKVHSFGTIYLCSFFCVIFVYFLPW